MCAAKKRSAKQAFSIARARAAKKTKVDSTSGTAEDNSLSKETDDREDAGSKHKENNGSDSDSLDHPPIMRSPTPKELKLGVSQLFKPDRQSASLSVPILGVEPRDVFCIKCIKELSKHPQWMCQDRPISAANRCYSCHAKNGMCEPVLPELYNKAKHIMDMAAEYNAGRHRSLTRLRLAYASFNLAFKSLNYDKKESTAEFKDRPWVPVERAIASSTNSILDKLSGLRRAADE
ncbi:hypothetical protein B7494_g8393, partial [Chlorociboria aeruginascens]